VEEDSISKRGLAVTNKAMTENRATEAREAVNAFFDALSAWREEVASSTERFSNTVLDKMAAAATAMGWPKEMVEASHRHLVQASKMQIGMIDQLMDAWQAQVKSPMPTQFVAQHGSFSGLGPASAMSDLAPVQFWMEMALVWQRNWDSAISTWTGAGRAQQTARTSRHH
jgi:hypothetical protein